MRGFPVASRATAVFAACLALLSCAAPEADEPGAHAESGQPQPNILFLFADDQRADTIGAY